MVNEGLYAQVSCIVQSGDLPITISWSLKGDVISSEPGLTTSQLGQRASILSIDSVGYRHSGTYTCTARNEAGISSSSAELKVNGMPKREIFERKVPRMAWKKFNSVEFGCKIIYSHQFFSLSH